jgi:quinol monooxygenase YgiN
MILANIRFLPKHDNRDNIVRTIRGLLEPTRVEPGCLGFSCHQDIESNDVMILEERWETRTDLERHVRSEGFRTILSVLDECTEEPVVEFHDVTNTGGMERIGEIRGNSTQNLSRQIVNHKGKEL